MLAAFRTTPFVRALSAFSLLIVGEGFKGSTPAPAAPEVSFSVVCARAVGWLAADSPTGSCQVHQTTAEASAITTTATAPPKIQERRFVFGIASFSRAGEGLSERVVEAVTISGRLTGLLA